MTVTTKPLTAADRDAWLALWNAYLVFYETDLADEVTDAAWARIFDPAEPVYGLGAFDGDTLVGICHFLFHRSTWSLGSYCYLEDLFVDPASRGSGAGRALIEGVAQAAVAEGATKLYWQTQQTNATARGLYDRVARHAGYIVYERDLA